jgi:hypothetical protein
LYGAAEKVVALREAMTGEETLVAGVGRVLYGDVSVLEKGVLIDVVDRGVCPISAPTARPSAVVLKVGGWTAYCRRFGVPPKLVDPGYEY